jgi:hypothetical protein
VASFRSAFREAMEALGYGEAPERQLTPAEVSQRARAIAAAEGIKYKSARRRIERRRTTGKEARGQPNRRLAQRIRQRGLRVYAELEMDPSPDPRGRPDMRPRKISVELSGAQLEDVADAIEAGNLGRAEDQFREAMLREYEDVGEDEPSFLSGADIGEVDELSIELGTGDGD